MKNKGRRKTGVGILAATLCALTACDNAGEDRVLAIGPTGSVRGFTYFDENGDRVPDAGLDTPMPGVRVVLLVRGGIDTVAEATSGVDGGYVMPNIPVGTYTLEVDTTTVGDTVEVVRIDTALVQLLPEDTTTVEVAISYPSVTTAQARALTQGTKVFIKAIALNTITIGTSGAFGDTTVHIFDNAGFLRATNVQRATVIQGDSVRFLGSVRQRAGEPVLDQVEAFFVQVATTPPPENVTTAMADAADGGRLDAALVRVVSAVVTDTATIQGGFLVTVNDGSGQLDVDIRATTLIVIDSTSGIVPSATGDFTGVLVPTGTGRWTLRPRSDADIVIP